MKDRILALDPATHTGWAFWDGGKCKSGVFANPVTHGAFPCTFFDKYSIWLRCMEITYQPVHVLWCEVFPRSRAAQQVAHGLRAVTLLNICDSTGWAEVGEGDVKRAATGNGNAPKDAIVSAMRERWNRPDLSDDNEADALALLAWYLDQEEK